MCISTKHFLLYLNRDGELEDVSDVLGIHADSVTMVKINEKIK